MTARAQTGRTPAWTAAAAGLLLAAAAAPLWAGRFLPLLDLPQHLGLAAVLSRYGEPGNAFARYYAVDPATPYWGYYATVWLLTRALPLETASRVAFTAYAVATPLAVAALLAAFGRDRRWAVFSVPLVLNTNLFFGFATFVLSIPLLLLALAATERHLARPRASPRAALSVALLAAAVLLFHVQSFLLLALCVLVLLAAHARGARWALARAAPFAPAVALLAAWAGRSFGGRGAPAPRHTPGWSTFGTFAHLGASWEPWRVVLARVPERIAGAFADRSDTLLVAALLGILMVALATGYGPLAAVAVDGGAPPGRLRRAVLAHRGDLVVAALAASYLFLPMQIAGQWYLNARYLIFVPLALPLLVARPARGWRLALVAAAGAVSLACAANAAWKVRAFQPQVGPFAEVARALPAGGRVLGLPFDTGARGPVRLWPFLHWACWQQVIAGGDVGFSFAGLPGNPVQYRPGMQAPHPSEWRPEDFDWATMGAAYDAFLVSGAPRGHGGAELTRHAVPVARAGPWSLWRPRDGLDHSAPSD